MRNKLEKYRKLVKPKKQTSSSTSVDVVSSSEDGIAVVSVGAQIVDIDGNNLLEYDEDGTAVGDMGTTAEVPCIGSLDAGGAASMQIIGATPSVAGSFGWGDSVENRVADAEGNVSVALQTAEAVETSFSNMTIGGGNMALRTETWLPEAFGNTPASTVKASNGVLEVPAGNITTDSNYASCIPGATYCIGINVKGAAAYEGNIVLVQFYNAAKTRIDQTWLTGSVTTGFTRRIGKFVAPSGAAFINIGLRASGGAAMSYAKLMLEKSDKHTDWKPAPEDVSAIIRDSAEGVLVGRPGFKVFALVNANGSYDIIDDSGSLLARFDDDEVTLGRALESSRINLCGNAIVNYSQIDPFGRPLPSMNIMAIGSNTLNLQTRGSGSVNVISNSLDPKNSAYLTLSKNKWHISGTNGSSEVPSSGALVEWNGYDLALGWDGGTLGGMVNMTIDSRSWTEGASDSTLASQFSKYSIFRVQFAGAGGDLTTECICMKRGTIIKGMGVNPGPSSFVIYAVGFTATSASVTLNMARRMTISSTGAISATTQLVVNNIIGVI